MYFKTATSKGDRDGTGVREFKKSDTAFFFALLLIIVFVPAINAMALDSSGFVFPVAGSSSIDPTTNMNDPLNDVWKGNGLGWSGDLGSGIYGYGHLGQDYYRKDSNGISKCSGAEGLSDLTVSQPVYAASNGEVVQVVNNPNTQYGWDDTSDHGWGRVIVIKHTITSGSFNTSNAMLTSNPNIPSPVVVYTLYGHLKKGSILVNIGDTVKKGQQIAKIGKGGTDVSWSCSHLHFEIKNEDAYSSGELKNGITAFCCGNQPTKGIGFGYSGTNDYAPNRYIPSTFIPNNTSILSSSIADRIQKRLEIRTPFPPYLLSADSFNDSISILWLYATSLLTGNDLAKKYDELYLAGVEYTYLRVKALTKAKNFLESGDTVNAEKFINKSDLYWKLSADSFCAAVDVFNGDLDAAETLAQGIKDGSEASLYVASILTPANIGAADWIQLLGDYAVKKVLSQNSDADKELVAKLLVKGLFEEIKVEKLGGKTVSEYMKAKSLGTLGSPVLDDLSKATEWSSAIKNILTNAGISLTQQAIDNIVSKMINEVTKNFIPIAQASSDVPTNIQSPFSSSLPLNSGWEGLNEIHQWGDYWVQDVFHSASSNKGILIYNPTYNKVFLVMGDIWKTVYEPMGGPNSWLGPPTSNEEPYPVSDSQSNVIQHFASGYITHLPGSIPYWQAHQTDTTSPTINIASPANSSIVSGTTSVTVSVNDDVGVVKVNYYLDSSTVAYSANSSPFSWYWNTTTASNGTHTLTAKAYDAAGNTGTSSITVSVNNVSGSGNNPPNIPTSLIQYKSDGMTGMAAGATTNERTVIMKGGVTDTDGNPVSLEVEVKPIGTAFSGVLSSYCTSGGAVSSGGTATATCTGLADGQYKWQARAKDSKGAVSSWLSAGGNSEDSADFVVSASSLKIGDWVKATANLNTRETAAGNLIKEMPSGSVGKIVDGPKAASYNSVLYTWWKIIWGDGTTGWSIQDYLSQIINYPPSVSLIAPNGGETFTVGTPYDIKWSASDSTGTIQSSDIYLSTDGGVTWPYNLQQINGSGSLYTWIPSVTTPQARIKVEVTDSYGGKGIDSSDGDFSIVSSCTSPSAPTLQSITASGSAYTVSWTASAGSTSYSLQEDTVSSFTNPVSVYTSSGTSWYSGAKSPNMYSYRVKASNSCGSSTWSNAQSVNIIGNQGPGTISVVSPVDSATGQPLSVTLSWSANHPGGENLRYNVYVVYAETTIFYPNNIKSYGQSASTYTIANLPYNTIISWGIEAVDDTGDTRFSPMFHFATIADSSAPTGSILINNGATSTTSYSVTLNLSANDSGSGVRDMRFSNDGANWSFWEYYAPQYPWNLADTNYGGKYGLSSYTVYAQFRDYELNISSTYSDSITKTTGTPGNILLNGKSYETIQDAINAANSGDTVYLTEGTYTIKGNVNPPRYPSQYVGIVMKDGVSLVGAGAEKTTITLDGTSGGLFTIIDANNSVIEGLTIINPELSWVRYAILLESNSSKVKNCIIKGGYGGIQVGWDSTRQASNAEISNNLIINNKEGIRLYYGLNISIYNNTITFNTPYCGICTNVNTTNIINNIISNNGSGISVGGVNPTIKYNDVFNTGGNYGGISDQTGTNGNISVDPKFVNPSSGDYHLNSSSPCVNAGTNVGIPYSGSAPDMGAYEYNGTGTIQVTSNRGDAAFTIKGPSGSYNGSGTIWSTSSMPIGIYTITFTPIANLYSPSYQSKMLYSGQTLTFDGTYLNDTTGPTGTMSVNFAEYATADNLVTITFDLTDEVGGLGTGSQMMFSNDGVTWSTAETYSSIKKDWDVTLYGGNTTSGIKTIYAKVSDSLGNWTTLTDSILYVPNRQILEVPTQYTSIQAAINAAQDGDTVYVLPGIYAENLTLKQGVRLQGAGPSQTFLEQKPSGSGIIITTANNSMIDGFSIGQTGGYISISNRDESIISNNIIYGTRGIDLGEHSSPIIRNNLLRTSCWGILATGSGTGETLIRIQNNTITSITFTCGSAPSIGIVVGNATTLTKLYSINNIIAGNGIGLIDYNTSDTTHQHIYPSFNTYWNNSKGNFGELDSYYSTANYFKKMGSGDMNLDPIFVNAANNDFHLQSGSGSINSGDPEAKFSDPDGTTNDRGAYGGPTLNTPPKADFSIYPLQGSTSTIYSFDAGLSKDGESKDDLLEVRWDWDGDGAYDSNFSKSKNTYFMYSSAGNHNVTLQVKDSGGFMSAITKTVIVINQSPNVPNTPSPSDGSTGQSIATTLIWNGGDPDSIDAVTYDVYFGKSSNPSLVSAGQSSTYFSPGELDFGSTYYWKVIATDSQGAISDGPVWYFVTESPADPKTYAITASSGSNGNITPSGTVTVNQGVDQTFTITPNSGYLVSDVVVDDSSVGSATSYTFTNITDNHTISATFAGYSMKCNDSGTILCIERTDGGSDADNLQDGKPKVDLEYEFKATVKDTGGTPQYVKIYLTQRSTPFQIDFYAYTMTCSGDYTAGATCTYSTKLGPASIHKFYLEATMSSGTVIRYPSSGYITGPTVKLATGYNIVGAPRDINTANLGGLSAFGSQKTYRWVSDSSYTNGGYYVAVTSSNPAVAGEGYFVMNETTTLPELEGYGEGQGPNYTYQLQPGWNLISNPYAGNIKLIDIMVKNGGTGTSVTWTQAVTNGWLTNAIYYYNGADWGKTYSFESAGGTPDATLVPWMGYWIELKKTDAVYYLVIPKP